MPNALAERTGVLVVRVWIEADDRSLRARVTGRFDVRGEETSVTLAGAGATTAFVGAWLERFEDGHRSPEPL